MTAFGNWTGDQSPKSGGDGVGEQRSRAGGEGRKSRAGGEGVADGRSKCAAGVAGEKARSERWRTREHATNVSPVLNSF